MNNIFHYNSNQPLLNSLNILTNLSVLIFGLAFNQPLSNSLNQLKKFHKESYYNKELIYQILLNILYYQIITIIKLKIYLKKLNVIKYINILIILLIIKQLHIINF